MADDDDFDPGSGRAFFLVAGVLVAIVLAGGVLMFNGTPDSRLGTQEQARQLEQALEPDKPPISMPRR